MKTLVSTFFFPILLEFFNQQPYLHGLLNDQLLICILGGFLLGLGIGLVLKAGGSTGGFDILALIVEKYFKVPLMQQFLFYKFHFIVLLKSFMES